MLSPNQNIIIYYANHKKTFMRNIYRFSFLLVIIICCCLKITAQPWLLQGNVVLPGNLNYIGTVNNQDFHISTDNVNPLFLAPLKQKMVVTKSGNVGIGY